jgi:hypothetical protein
LIYESDVIDHSKATDVSFELRAITVVSYFISSFQRPIKPPVKLGMAKRKPKVREERKNEAIIYRKCLPHHESQLLREHVQSSPITFSYQVVEI